MTFVRAASGRLRRADEGIELDDIWAEQKRLKLKEAIIADKKKAAKRQRRKSFFGVFAAPKASTQEHPRTVEIKISLPALHAANLRAWLVKHKLLHRPTKRRLIPAGIALVVLLFFVAGFNSYGNAPAEEGREGKLSPSVLGADEEPEVPAYRTVLPEGKSITDLGGWARVSPPGAEPVFAFVDTVDGIQINVSQQPLPDNFKDNTAEEIKKLAAQFSATEAVTVGGITAYVGTSVNGPQSVIMTKEGLLVLMKSSSALAPQQWEGYINTLR
jgi:hypothetical protein